MRLTLAVLVLFGSLAAARADVVVTVAPQGAASDFIYRSSSERDALVREISGLLRKLGRDALPKDQTLTVELLDIRPAGRIDPFSNANQIRVLSGATPPSVRLRYALKRRGRVITRGEERVSDLNYLENISARSSLSSFPYERELMRDWFRDRIVRLRPQRG